MPKAKPISLYPLTFEEAMKRLISLNPQHRNRQRKRKPKSAHSKVKK